jgi:hypothetical protein
MELLTRLSLVVGVLVLVVVSAGCSDESTASTANANDGVLDPVEQAAFVRTAGGDIPLPPGGTWDALIENVQQNPASMEETGFLDMMAYHASCQWYRYYLSALAGDNADAADEALEVISQIPSWPQLQGGSVVFSEIAAEAELGATDKMRAQVATNCSI